MKTWEIVQLVGALAIVIALAWSIIDVMVPPSRTKALIKILLGSYACVVMAPVAMAAWYVYALAIAVALIGVADLAAVRARKE